MLKNLEPSNLDKAEYKFEYKPKGESGKKVMYSVAYSREIAENQARAYCNRNGHEFLRML